jgi:hypothetical protein
MYTSIVAPVFQEERFRVKFMTLAKNGQETMSPKYNGDISTYSNRIINYLCWSGLIPVTLNERTTLTVYQKV